MSEYTKVVLEAHPGGRLSISALDERGYGHGYRISGRKFNDATIVPNLFGPPTVRNLDPLVTHELDDRDADEIRVYLRKVDEIHDAGWPAEVHDLTAALDRWKAHTQGVPNRHKSREPEAREWLRETCAALAARFGTPSSGVVALRKLVVQVAADDPDGSGVEVDDVTAERIVLAVLGRIGGTS